MSNLNGANHHNVEELLANIRSSFSEDSGFARSPLRAGHNAGIGGAAQPQSQGLHAGHANGPHSNGQHANGSVGPLRGSPAPADDQSDFDLPAIFKPGHQSPADRPNLFGRLSDALKSQHAAPADQERSRTVIRFEPAGGRMIEPPKPEPEPMQQPRASANNSAEKVAAENASVKREMPSFFDTRLKGLGQSPKPEPQPEPPPTPQRIDPRDQQLPLSRPPALPPEGSMMMNNGAVEDAAAQMLRPILRQWLTENMPKIVEKALRSEAGDDVMPRPIDKDK